MMNRYSRTGVTSFCSVWQDLKRLKTNIFSFSLFPFHYSLKKIDKEVFCRQQSKIYNQQISNFRNSKNNKKSPIKLEKNNMPAKGYGCMRPKVIVNCAMSADGKIASRLRKQVRLSDEPDMARVHRLRNQCDAILVGVGTVIADDPSLLVKDKYVDAIKQPIRIVLDSKCSIPAGSRVLDGKAKTLVFVTEGHEKKLDGAEVISCGKETIDLPAMLKILEAKGVKTLLVEGGGRTIWTFVKARLVNEFKVFISNKLIGGSVAPTPMDGEGFGEEKDFAELKMIRTTMSDSGVLLEFEVK